MVHRLLRVLPRKARKHTVDSKKLDYGCRGPLNGGYRAIKGSYKAILECGCRMIYAGIPSCLVSGLEDGHVVTFWSRLSSSCDSSCGPEGMPESRGSGADRS